MTGIGRAAMVLENNVLDGPVRAVERFARAGGRFARCRRIRGRRARARTAGTRRENGCESGTDDARAGAFSCSHVRPRYPCVPFDGLGITLGAPRGIHWPLGPAIGRNGSLRRRPRPLTTALPRDQELETHRRCSRMVDARTFGRHRSPQRGRSAVHRRSRVRFGRSVRRAIRRRALDARLDGRAVGSSASGRVVWVFDPGGWKVASAESRSGHADRDHGRSDVRGAAPRVRDQSCRLPDRGRVGSPKAPARSKRPERGAEST